VTDSIFHREVHALLARERIMALASMDAGCPWCVHVYYAHQNNRFFFFSSPDSRHIRNYQERDCAAAAVGIDHPEWQGIRGIQMRGRVEPVRSAAGRLAALRLYLRKFPLVKEFLRDQAARGRLRLDRLLGQSIFVFIADEAYYLDNDQGFGHRLPVQL
jgi:uncharacterized protein YhbP (UPF0306 family)